MHKMNQKYITDERGNRTGVILHIKDYQRLLEALEELESIRAYDAARAAGDEAIPFEQALQEIEKAKK